MSTITNNRDIKSGDLISVDKFGPTAIYSEMPMPSPNVAKTIGMLKLGDIALVINVIGDAELLILAKGVVGIVLTATIKLIDNK